MAKLKFVELETEKNLFRIDLGCGKGVNTPEGFIKVDLNKSTDVEVMDLRKKWQWKSNSVDEIQANYLIHLFTMEERVHFFNELYRVLKKDSKALIMTPYWAAARAYSDPSVKMPPITEFFYPWLNKPWREGQNFEDVSGLNCNFEHTIGYGLHPMIIPRNPEYQQHAVSFWKEAAQDLIVTLIKV